MKSRPLFLSQDLPTTIRALALWLVTAITACAIADSNNNGVSDIWEKLYNSQQLIDGFDPSADPDGDGWTNQVEAIAGTDPFHSKAPLGIVQPVIIQIPAVYSTNPSGVPILVTAESMVVSWPTISGKYYQLQSSTDLTSAHWSNFRSPTYADGNPISESIQTTPSAATPPQACFWRVTISDIDSDNDGLTNAEELSLGSDTFKRDTDSDGVGDWAEVATYSSSPTTATDSDADTLPDVFERDFAAKLLQAHPASSHWGNKYAGLVAGNLDATYDYTGDGVSLKEFFTAFSNGASTDPLTTSHLIQAETRHVNVGGTFLPAFENNPERSDFYATFWTQEFPYPYGYTIPLTRASATAGFLASAINNSSWYSFTEPASLSYELHPLSLSCSSSFRSNYSSNGMYGCGGGYTQQRLRICATKLNHPAASFSFLKITSQPNNDDPSAIISVESVTHELEVDRMLTQWINIDATMGTQQRLIPMDIQLAIPTPEATAQPPVLAISRASTVQFQYTSLRLNSQSSGDIDFATAPSVIIPEEKEDTEGAWAVLNFDDDDEDGGASTHGRANIKGDWEDTNGVEGENDLIYLAIRKVYIPGTKFRLKFDNEHIRVYQKSNKTEPVISEQTELTVEEDKEYLTLFVEGIKPHENDEGTIITQQIKIGASGDWNLGDTAKVRVAQPIIAVFEENPDWADTYAHFNNFGKEKAGDDESRKRFTLKSAGTQPDTFMAPGKFYKSGGAALKDVCYSFSQIKGARGERILKIALALQDANVITIGHSNFGMGLAFKGQYTEFTDFFNVAGGGKPAINLTHGFPAHPALNVSGIFTNLAAVNKINSLRWTSAANRWMTNNPLPNIERYPNTENPVIAPGSAFPVYAETITQVGSNNQTIGSRVLNWNYKPVPGLEGDSPNDKRVILDIPSTDVPATLKYRSLYLNQCASYRYFLESFHHGTVFATWGCIRPDNHGHEGFINKMLEGATWESVEVELEEKEAFDDIVGAPKRNRIELSNF